MALWIAIAAAVLCFYGQWRYFRTHWERALSVRLSFGRKGVRVGEPCTLEEVVSNAKGMPLPALQVKFQTSADFRFDMDRNASVTDHYYRTDLFAAGGNQRITRMLEFVPTHRGYYEILALDVLARDYFFTSQYSVRRANHTALYVYPARREVKRFAFLYRRMSGELLARRRMEEDPFAFRGMREYRTTDSMRRINWKSSARQGKLLVNLYESSFSQEICILLDGSCRWERDQEVLQEGVISIASSVAAFLLQKGIPVSLVSNIADCRSGEAVRCEAGGSRRHLQELDRRLARMNPEAQTMPFPALVREETKQGAMQKGVCYLVITSDPSEALWHVIQERTGQGTDIYGILVWHEMAPELREGFLGWEV